MNPLKTLILYSSCLHRASMIIKHFIIQLMPQYILCRYNYNYKTFRSAPTCFGSQRIHHQGALYSAWLKITRMILSCPLTWTGSVLWQHIVTRCACELHANGHDRIILVILAKHCTRFPDDGSSVNRNMLEHF